MTNQTDVCVWVIDLDKKDLSDTSGILNSELPSLGLDFCPPHPTLISGCGYLSTQWDVWGGYNNFKFGGCGCEGGCVYGNQERGIVPLCEWM